MYWANFRSFEVCQRINSSFQFWINVEFKNIHASSQKPIGISKTKLSKIIFCQIRIHLKISPCGSFSMWSIEIHSQKFYMVFVNQKGGGKKWGSVLISVFVHMGFGSGNFVDYHCRIYIFFSRDPQKLYYYVVIWSISVFQCFSFLYFYREYRSIVISLNICIWEIGR